MKKIVMILSSLILTGCFPIIEKIYKPTTKGGTLLETSCNFDSGPGGRWDKIELIQDKVVLHAQVKKSQGDLIIYISLYVPEGKEIQFTQSNAIISGKNESKQLIINSFTSYDKMSKKTTQDSTSLLIGGATSDWSRLMRAGSFSKQFETFLRLANQPLSDEFTLTLPAFRSNEGMFTFPSIKFEPKVQIGTIQYCP